MSVSHVTVRWGTEGCFHELGSRAFENKIVMQSCLLQEVYFPPFPVIVSHTLRLGGTPARTSVAPGQVFFVEAISWGAYQAQAACSGHQMGHVWLIKWNYLPTCKN